MIYPGLHLAQSLLILLVCFTLSTLLRELSLYVVGCGNEEKWEEKCFTLSTLLRELSLYVVGCGNEEKWVKE